MAGESGRTNVGHIRQNGDIQTLESHLFGTAELAESFMSVLGVRDVGMVVGLLHDLGKASAEFNDYIRGDSDCTRGEIDHSTAGAQFIQRRMEPLNGENLPLCCARQMMSLAIASHHSGMIDCISLDGTDNYLRRMGKDVRTTHLEESLGNIGDDVMGAVGAVIDGAERSLSELIMGILRDSVASGIRDKGHFRLGLLARYILSCLIDADRLDTARFMDGSLEERPAADWSVLGRRLDESLTGFNDDSEISSVRRSVSDECLFAATSEKGIRTLSVPTGGGKTLASLRYAIGHAAHHGMDRIIYVVPYTTIIEQNAAVVRSILDPDDEGIVVECHSNVDVGESGDESYRWSSVSDRWDSPIVFTTMVQFLETLFSQGSKRTRRMHNLANSVIVFDEIQTVPVKSVYMYIEALNFLVRWCGSSAVLCTATQPLLGNGLDYNLFMAPSAEMMNDVGALSERLRRVDISVMGGGRIMGAKEICNAVPDLVDRSGSVLVIANTKRMARRVHEILSDTLAGVRLYHLSTNMCPAHRSEVIDDMMSRLGTERVVCVSTQLIEAGVDVDFGAVVRCMAGLDSIVQAAGRCNRHGRMARMGTVLVAKTDEDLGMLPDILEGRRCTEQLIAEGHQDLLSEEAMARYFELYMYRRSRGRKDLYYPTRDGTLFDMLSHNSESVSRFTKMNGARPGEVMRQAFHEAGSRFRVIDVTDAVVVPFDDRARQAISFFSRAMSTSDRLKALRIMQRYSINTFGLRGMIDAGVAYEIAEGSGVYALAEGNYNDTYGLDAGSNVQALVFRSGG